MTISMMLYSVPYILVSNMRPVIGYVPWPTRVESVFTAKKEDLLFAINPEAQQLDFYIRSPQPNSQNHPGREVFDHFFAMDVTWH